MSGRQRSFMPAVAGLQHTLPEARQLEFNPQHWYTRLRQKSGIMPCPLQQTLKKLHEAEHVWRSLRWPWRTTPPSEVVNKSEEAPAAAEVATCSRKQSVIITIGNTVAIDFKCRITAQFFPSGYLLG
eukprot:TRINITY_DN19820_c0_g1_i1.p2 TRINITY_DN19820_c0_g1~~TRINITY_DN19820_c0_g1_i1.p2  ORF type:complete len:127 (-),score=1.99 TRINITY_DN19820_c0_g1_i1:177-557(-)